MIVKNLAGKVINGSRHILLQFRQEIIICLKIDDCSTFQPFRANAFFIYNYIADFLQLLIKRNLKEYLVRLGFIKFYFFR